MSRLLARQGLVDGADLRGLEPGLDLVNRVQRERDPEQGRQRDLACALEALERAERDARALRQPQARSSLNAWFHFPERAADSTHTRHMASR